MRIVRETAQTKTNEQRVSVEFLHTGSTLLNLAISGKGIDGGWPRGRIVNIVGDGSSGKTLLALELCAYVFYRMEGNKSQNFPDVKKVRIIYDNVEMVMDFNLDQMYGKRFRQGIIWGKSITVQEWGRKFAKEIEANKPGELLLYVVDSLDALSSQEGLDRFDKAVKNDKEEDGAYGTEKAKYLSQSFFDNICSKMQGKDVTLVIISQIRQRIGITYGKKYSRSGGKALDFYTHCVVWLYEQEKLKKTFHGDSRVYGIRVLAKIERNKVAKPYREAEIIFLFDYGVDNLGMSLDFFYGSKVQKLLWDGTEYSRQDLIRYIEEHNLQKELSKRVEINWNEIEEAIKVDRKPKFPIK